MPPHRRARRGDRRGRARAQSRRRRSPLRPVADEPSGVGWILAYTIAAEIGDVARFANPTKLVSYTGLCPRVYQSGETDHRGSLSKVGPRYLRWAFIEAAVHAARHPLYAERYQHTAHRLGRQRGKKIARVDIARRLAEASWHMLSTTQPFAREAPQKF